MIIGDNKKDYTIFSVVHSEFYETFEPWRKGKLLSASCKDGVYVLKSERPIPRVLGEDKEGILYIGKGIILSTRHRIGKLINALNKTEARHDGGVRVTEKIRERYPLDSMQLYVRVCDSPRETEAALLKKYCDTFGELPPFNHQH